MVVYYARPEDWIPGLAVLPLAKITAILALLALIFSVRYMRQRLPREALLLVLLIVQLFLASMVSPVWRGGALQITIDFSKVLILVIVMAMAVDTAQRLRRLIFIQAASIVVIAAVAVLKGRLLVGRLEGMLGGNYSNPNDLALSIVISLPLCLALLFLSRSSVGKTAWAFGMLVMTYAVLLTASRGGFLSLLVVAAACLWEFAIRGRRRYLLVLVALVGALLWNSSGTMLYERLDGTFDPRSNVASAYGSSQQRQQVLWRSIEVTEEHPLFGVGPGNFQVLSGSWHATHNSFTQMSSEGGVPAFILYALILCNGFANLWSIERLTRGERQSNVLARALKASLAGYVVGSLFASTAYEFFPYILVAYTSALFLIAKKSVSSSKGHESVSHTLPEKEIHADTRRAELSWYSS